MDSSPALLDGLSGDAEKLLHGIIEGFRKQMAPEQSEEEFRESVLELMGLGLAKIYAVDGGYTLKPTPLGETLGGRPQ